MKTTQDVEGAQALDEDFDDINADVTTEHEVWAAEPFRNADVDCV